MYYDRALMDDGYPFEGVFYSYAVDESVPLEERQQSETEVLRVSCDIQEYSKSGANGVLVAAYNVYFLFDTTVGVPIKRGMIFKGDMYGVAVRGIVTGLFPTQLGGCICQISEVGV